MPVIEDPPSSSSSSSSRRQGQGSHASGAFRGSSTPFLPSRFRGLGCAASAAARQVSVPEAIRASAEWERGRDKESEREVGGRRKGRGVVLSGRRKKKEGGFLRRRGTGGGDEGIDLISGCGSGHACGVVEDAAWCGMGVGVAGEVDFVVATGGGGGRRDRGGGGTGGRGRSDTDRISQRERPSLRRPNVNPENLYLDFDPGLTHPRLSLDLYGSSLRRYRHPSPEGLAEAMMLKTSLMMTGERVHGPDRYHGWRLDVDNMSYEQLLELGDRIGYVSTGLKEDEIRRCIRKIKISSLTGLAHILSNKADRKCSICQEEYEEEDDLGKLSCGHGYHLPCIRQWLSQKNTCPVCKSDAIPRT
ncbi:hypothetical protein MLD38_038295 [Melastoma candidum]|uniref:Uncharacterized protein n=1 Tax=Melastoma candidum TaxID=119954 RepID=A0ACB9KZH9_9MYRT|nr:hypothetical protein MLD38_038295 [Melastoma candidum]